MCSAFFRRIPCGLGNKIIYRLIKSGRFQLHAITFCLKIGYSCEPDGLFHSEPLFVKRKQNV
ncbi:hypothetical protein HKQ44_06300 [Neisseria meningitidis]|uniref:Uncharacterized protein n=1 Tax=Neisseria meningitidis serogroup B (strain ATCC BAA-335 / MC58) TaxID=122586 RepID=Q9JYQ4_NEIMB|nr:hypothetical protein NMB1477 [Neisseria meningitidis MC58]ARC08904.1 hypothetical protein A6J49_04325 [Neisseria meningitidis]MBG8577711.1 hypothetical protein [Neisseria meningitidis]MBG8594165.1 hypothetical protein [Neisseria meningitidis]MBG8601884.1 hypothetical protein [Neisseria meningitidis]